MSSVLEIEKEKTLTTGEKGKWQLKFAQANVHNESRCIKFFDFLFKFLGDCEKFLKINSYSVKKIFSDFFRD